MAGSTLFAVGDVQIGGDGGSFAPVHCTRPVVSALGTWPTAATWVEGLNIFSPVDVQSKDVPYFHRPGSRPGSDIAGTRKVEFTIRMQAVSAAALRTRLDGLMRHLRPIILDPYTWGEGGSPILEAELAFRTGTGDYVMYGRYRNVSGADVRWLARNQVSIGVRFDATDPVIYETTIQSLPIAKSNTVVPHPVAFNASTGSPTAPTDAFTSISPNGNAPARWRITMRGPSINPMVWVKQYASGGVFGSRTFFAGLGGNPTNWNQAAGTGNNVVFDSGQRSVVYSGLYADQYLTVGSSWPEIWPYAELTYSPRGSVSHPDTTAASAQIDWQRGWWAVV